MIKKLCKNCKHWERRTLYKYEYKNQKESWFEYESKPDSYTHRKKKPVIEESKFGYCNCEKIIYTRGGGCVEDDDVEHQNQPDAFLYSDGEAYGAYHYTGENFGCVHFRTK